MIYKSNDVQIIFKNYKAWSKDNQISHSRTKTSGVKTFNSDAIASLSSRFQRFSFLGRSIWSCHSLGFLAGSTPFRKVRYLDLKVVIEVLVFILHIQKTSLVR
jgi:hypothetical protein